MRVRWGSSDPMLEAMSRVSVRLRMAGSLASTSAFTCSGWVMETVTSFRISRLDMDRVAETVCSVVESVVVLHRHPLADGPGDAGRVRVTVLV